MKDLRLQRKVMSKIKLSEMNITIKDAKCDYRPLIQAETLYRHGMLISFLMEKGKIEIRG